MSTLKIVMIDADTGHTVKTLHREWPDEKAVDAAADAAQAIDMMSDGQTTDVEDA